MKKIDLKIKVFKQKSAFKKKNSEINPDFYWRIVLWSALALMLAGAGFGFYLFTQMKQPEGSTNQISGIQAGTVKKERLDAALKYFSDRKAFSDSVISNPAPIVDPSL